MSGRELAGQTEARGVAPAPGGSSPARGAEGPKVFPSTEIVVRVTSEGRGAEFYATIDSQGHLRASVSLREERREYPTMDQLEAYFKSRIDNLMEAFRTFQEEVRKAQELFNRRART